MQSDALKSVQGERRFEYSAIMKSRFLRSLPAGLVTCLAIVLPLFVTGAFAQTSNDDKAKQQQQQQQADPKADPKKDPPRRDDLAEVSKQITGPAGNPECVWLGRRVVHLLWRDDLDTAFRHLDLYDRFGCPGGHIQATFRCVVKQGPIDPKLTDSLQSRVHSCWVNPAAPPAPAAAAGTPAQGTSTQ
jgi:hypothetical protein